jgi:hypothetical protein
MVQELELDVLKPENSNFNFPNVRHFSIKNGPNTRASIPVE